jgi:hypothetical protein
MKFPAPSALRKTTLSALIAVTLWAGPLLRASAFDDLMAGLRQALAAPAGASPSNPQVSQYLNALGNAMAKGKYADAEQTLKALRSGYSSGNPTIETLLDKMLVEIQTASAVAMREQDRALDEIVSDAANKAVAGAKVAEFDPIFVRLANLLEGLTQTNDPAAKKIELVQTFVMRAQDYLQQKGANNPDQAVAALKELTQIAGRLPSVPRSKLLALQTEVAARIAARNEAIAARFESLKNTVRGLIDSAKGPDDFDQVLSELSVPPTFGLESTGNLPAQFESLRRYARRWQDHFTLLERGDTAGALSILRDLSNDNTFDSFYPRSRLLARLTEKKAAPAIDPDSTDPLVAPDALTLDTLEKFARQIAARAQSGGMGAGREDLAHETALLRTAATQLKLGDAKPAFMLAHTQGAFSRVGEYSFVLARLRQSLILQALPISINAPDGLKTAEKDTPESYLKRAMQYGREQSDWLLISRALGTYQALNLEVAPGSLQTDRSSFQQFLTGLNQERAEEWSAAVRAYQIALRSAGPNLPAEEIGRRIRAIKEAHPKEYEAAGRQSEFGGAQTGTDQDKKGACEAAKGPTSPSTEVKK